MQARKSDLEPLMFHNNQWVTGALEVVPESEQVEVCDLCWEPAYKIDGLGIWKDPNKFGEQITAHESCGADRELELA